MSASDQGGLSIVSPDVQQRPNGSAEAMSQANMPAAAGSISSDGFSLKGQLASVFDNKYVALHDTCIVGFAGRQES